MVKNSNMKNIDEWMDNETKEYKKEGLADFDKIGIVFGLLMLFGHGVFFYTVYQEEVSRAYFFTNEKMLSYTLGAIFMVGLFFFMRKKMKNI